jgi:hypothetical protein
MKLKNQIMTTMRTMTIKIQRDLEPTSVANFFTREEIEYFNKYLSQLPAPTTDIDTKNLMRGIDVGHPLYSWFMKKIFSKIRDQIGEELQLTYAEYLTETVPWPVHSDYAQKNLGEPFRTFLIPIAVNENINLVEKTNTVMFNELDTFADANQLIGKKFWYDTEWIKNKSPKENSAFETCYQLASQNAKEDMECLTLLQVLNWKQGCLLHWDARLMHSSDNFILNGVKSKQAIVMHTYVV